MKNHSNLQYVTASNLRSINFRSKEKHRLLEEPCIVLYVHFKGIIPTGEKPFPKTIEGIPVDVREGYFEFLVGPSEKHENVRMACQIGSVFASGTLGAFVELPNNRTGCLTCWHIFQPTNDVRSDDTATVDETSVYQPDSSDESHMIGNVIEKVLREGNENVVGLDAALVEIRKERWPINGEFPETDQNISASGFSSDRPMKFTSGKVENAGSVKWHSTVVKYGAKSIITKGTLALSGAGVRNSTFKLHADREGQYQLHQQLEILPAGSNHWFSKPGDSGALVFTVSQNDDHDVILTGLGLVVGATQDKRTVVTPIWEILKHFKLGESLLTFPVEISSSQDDLLCGSNIPADQPPSLEGNIAKITEDMSNQKEQMRDVRVELKDVKDQLSNLKDVPCELKTVKEQISKLRGDVSAEISAKINANMQSGMDAIAERMQAKINENMQTGMTALSDDMQAVLSRNMDRFFNEGMLAVIQNFNSDKEKEPTHDEKTCSTEMDLNPTWDRK